MAKVVRRWEEVSQGILSGSLRELSFDVILPSKLTTITEMYLTT